jgi:hypothetical protein
MGEVSVGPEGINRDPTQQTCNLFSVSYKGIVPQIIRVSFSPEKINSYQQKYDFKLAYIKTRALLAEVALPHIFPIQNLKI